MKGKLIRMCVVANDAAETMRDFNDLFGVEFYGPFDDEHVKLKVALPRSGGMEVSSPTAADDPIGFSQYLAANGEGIKGIALRVDNIQEAMDELKAKGVELGVYFEHNLMKECIIPPQPKTHNIEVALNEFPDEDPVGQAVARDMGIDLYA
ncbi:VOC family protein [Adlercreutzia equolifaciens]|uniref:VOC family protein n=1 Tax=Adlercreutzia equolifaciens TaxID=446660 RepID=UPI003A865388